MYHLLKLNVLLCYIVTATLIMSCGESKLGRFSGKNIGNQELNEVMFPNNPIVKDVGMADPHIRIFNGKPYLYATRDEDKTAQTFVMPDWKIWTSNDLLNWNLATTIDPAETYMGVSKRCWATDAAHKNGNYYFYFSNGNTDTGVMVGKTPIGPFKDALGKPILPEDLTPTKEYDPTILIDDDKKQTAYIAFGHHRSADPDYYYMIAKLNEDMISLAEAPKEIKILGDVNVLAGNDKPTLHKRNGVYYLSAGSHYAISKNVYGPYVKTGNSGNNSYGLDSRAHGNYFDWNNQSFHIWCHFHLGKDVARYRESYISYLHYRDNGEMVTDTNFLDAHFSTGVGQYDAKWDKIEAEWYMASEGMLKKERDNSSNGFILEQESDNGFLYFPNMYHLSSINHIICHAIAPNGGEIEVRKTSKDGDLIAKIKLSKLKGTFQNYKVNVRGLAGTKNIFLIFKGKGIALDWFKFE